MNGLLCGISYPQAVFSKTNSVLFVRVRRAGYAHRGAVSIMASDSEMRSALEKWSVEEIISSDLRGAYFNSRTLPLLPRGRFRLRSQSRRPARDDEAQVEPNAHLWWRRVQEAGRLPVLQERRRAGGESRRGRRSVSASAGGSQALWLRGSGVLSVVTLARD